MKKLYKLWCALIHKCPKCGEHLACNDNQFAYGNWYCPNCDGNCEEIESNNIIEQYIPKSALVAEIEKWISGWTERLDNTNPSNPSFFEGGIEMGKHIRSFIDTLEVTDPYEQRIQFASVKDGIEYHASIYSFNIESELFNQLTTKEQQGLWRKEIEQAYISGGEVGVELARDLRYKENLEVKEVKSDRKFECPNIKIEDAIEVSSRMKYIDEDLKPIAEFIMDYCSWNLHKDEWSQPTIEVPLFRVLDALVQRGKPYRFR